MIYHLLLQEFLYQCHQVAQYDEGTWCQYEDEHTVSLAIEVQSEDTTCTQQLTHCTNQSQCQRKTKTHAQTVQSRQAHGVLSSKRFSTTKHDTVHHNQRDKQTQHLIDSRLICLHQELHHRHESSNHHDKRRDTHFVGNQVLQE